MSRRSSSSYILLLLPLPSSSHCFCQQQKPEPPLSDRECSEEAVVMLSDGDSALSASSCHSSPSQHQSTLAATARRSLGKMLPAKQRFMPQSEKKVDSHEKNVQLLRECNYFQVRGLQLKRLPQGSRSPRYATGCQMP